jgi:hypothetical protein
MARRKVVTTPMMKIVRESPKGSYLGWGKTQVRKLTTEATAPKLLKYRSCVAGELAGKEYKDLKSVQEAFREAAHRCKEKVRKELGEVIG